MNKCHRDDKLFAVEECKMPMYQDEYAEFTPTKYNINECRDGRTFYQLGVGGGGGGEGLTSDLK